MCGIVGYCGKRNASEIIYKGLKQLEYRGYDSAGIAVVSDGTVSAVKKQGRVANIEAEAKALRGNVGIGHTRWATHGPYTRQQAVFPLEWVRQAKFFPYVSKIDAGYGDRNLCCRNCE